MSDFEFDEESDYEDSSDDCESSVGEISSDEDTGGTDDETDDDDDDDEEQEKFCVRAETEHNNEESSVASEDDDDGSNVDGDDNEENSVASEERNEDDDDGSKVDGDDGSIDTVQSNESDDARSGVDGDATNPASDHGSPGGGYTGNKMVSSRPSKVAKVGPVEKATGVALGKAAAQTIDLFAKEAHKMGSSTLAKTMKNDDGVEKPDKKPKKKGKTTKEKPATAAKKKKIKTKANEDDVAEKPATARKKKLETSKGDANDAEKPATATKKKLKTSKADEDDVAKKSALGTKKKAMTKADEDDVDNSASTTKKKVKKTISTNDTTAQKMPNKEKQGKKKTANEDIQNSAMVMSLEFAAPVIFAIAALAFLLLAMVLSGTATSSKARVDEAKKHESKESASAATIGSATATTIASTQKKQKKAIAGSKKEKEDKLPDANTMDEDDSRPLDTHPSAAASIPERHDMDLPRRQQKAPAVAKEEKEQRPEATSKLPATMEKSDPPPPDTRLSGSTPPTETSEKGAEADLRRALLLSSQEALIPSGLSFDEALERALKLSKQEATLQASVPPAMITEADSPAQPKDQGDSPARDVNHLFEPLKKRLYFYSTNALSYMGPYQMGLGMKKVVDYTCDTFRIVLAEEDMAEDQNATAVRVRIQSIRSGILSGMHYNETVSYLSCGDVDGILQNVSRLPNHENKESTVFTMMYCKKEGTYLFKSHNDLFLHYNETVHSIAFQKCADRASTGQKLPKKKGRWDLLVKGDRFGKRSTTRSMTNGIAKVGRKMVGLS